MQHIAELIDMLKFASISSCRKDSSMYYDNKNEMGIRTYLIILCG